MPKEIIIAQDIDECLFNSVKKHHQELTKIGQTIGWENLPTYEEVCAVGGTDDAYGSYPKYWKKNEEMRNDPSFNQGLELIEDALEVLTFLQAMLGIYLTARSEHLSKVTREELAEAGFPQKEVVCRPRTIPLRLATPWKIDVLKQLSNGKIATMIDDSVKLHNTILKINDPEVGTILFAGPITPRGKGKTWQEIKKQLLKLTAK